MRKVHLLNLLNFLSAFLLFQIELISAKVLLPKFGGSYLVWGAAVVFFQCMLLFGYWYAHTVVTRIGMRAYARAHMLLLFLPLVVFPGRPLSVVSAHNGIPLVLDVFAVLGLEIGLVFFVLSTTTVVFQSWLSASDLPERSNPYALYAVSNLGSFAALVTYPFLFEPFLDIGRQLLAWRAGYAAFLVLNGIVFLSVRVKASSSPDSEAAPVPGHAAARRVSAADKVRWFLFSAAGVVAFLAVTNIVTYEIAPMPLLWVIPLSVYLFSFVLNFKQKPWCPAWIASRFHVIAALGIALFLATSSGVFPAALQCAAYFTVLFLVCMYCQHRLSLGRPSDRADLTLFYLVIAAGGFCAGVVTSWVMPLLTPGMTEYLLAFALIFLALAAGSFREPLTPRGLRMIGYTLAFIFLWMIVFTGSRFAGAAVLCAALVLIFCALKNNPKALCIDVIAVMCIVPFYIRSGTVFVARDYYGIHSVVDKGAVRVLMHGTTIHGLQYRDPARSRDTLGYYFPGSGIGKLMTSGSFAFKSVGIIGLGAGGITAYAREGQSFDVYEIDPLVYRIARTYFTFLRSCPAPVRVFLGDARVMLSGSQARYDLLVVDAFSGDSIPVHLITTDALALYRLKTAAEGIVLFHVSNRYLNLIPVVFANAQRAGAFCAYHIVRVESSLASFPSRWVAVTWDARAFEKLLADGWRAQGGERQHLWGVKAWTDEYSSILTAVEPRGLFGLSSEKAVSF